MGSDGGAEVISQRAEVRARPRLTMNEALRRLRASGAWCEVLTHGIIVCHRGDVHWCHPARGGTYSDEAISEIQSFFEDAR